MKIKQETTRVVCDFCASDNANTAIYVCGTCMKVACNYCGQKHFSVTKVIVPCSFMDKHGLGTNSVEFCHCNEHYARDIHPAQRAILQELELLDTEYVKARGNVLAKLAEPGIAAEKLAKKELWGME